MPAKKTAVLLIGFGGPASMTEVRPFLESVLEGVQLPQARFDDVMHHYEIIGGVSHYNSTTYKQREALQTWLKSQGSDLSVGVGFHHSSPSFKDAFETFKKYQVEKVIGFVLSPLRSYPSFQKYQERVETGKIAASAQDIEVVYTEPFFKNPLFIEAQSERVREIKEMNTKTFTFFTAHSIPFNLSQQSGYAEQFFKSAILIANNLGLGKHWDTVWQSRSGDPRDHWLMPDVKDRIGSIDKKKYDSVCLVPAGFLCDNVEVVYDLDIEAKNMVESIHLRYFRASTVMDHPKFIEMMGSQVLQKIEHSLLWK